MISNDFFSYICGLSINNIDRFKGFFLNFFWINSFNFLNELDVYSFNGFDANLLSNNGFDNNSVLSDNNALSEITNNDNNIESSDIKNNVELDNNFNNVVDNSLQNNTLLIDNSILNVNNDVFFKKIGEGLNNNNDLRVIFCNYFNFNFNYNYYFFEKNYLLYNFDELNNEEGVSIENNNNDDLVLSDSIEFNYSLYELNGNFDDFNKNLNNIILLNLFDCFDIESCSNKNFFDTLKLNNYFDVINDYLNIILNDLFNLNLSDVSTDANYDSVDDNNEKLNYLDNSFDLVEKNILENNTNGTTFVKNEQDFLNNIKNLKSDILLLKYEDVEELNDFFFIKEEFWINNPEIFLINEFEDKDNSTHVFFKMAHLISSAFFSIKSGFYLIHIFFENSINFINLIYDNNITSDNRRELTDLLKELNKESSINNYFEDNNYVFFMDSWLKNLLLKLNVYIDLNKFFLENKSFGLFDIDSKIIENLNNLSFFLFFFFNENDGYIYQSPFVVNFFDDFLLKVLNKSEICCKDGNILTDVITYDFMLEDTFDIYEFLAKFSCSLMELFLIWVNNLNFEDLYIILDQLVNFKFKEYAPEVHSYFYKKIKYYNINNMYYDLADNCYYLTKYFNDFIMGFKNLKRLILLNNYFSESLDLYYIYKMEILFGRYDNKDSFVYNYLFFFNNLIDFKKMCNPILIYTQLVVYGFFFYLLYSYFFLKNSKKSNDLLYFLSNNLTESEKELSSLDDAFFSYLFFFSIFFLYFLEYVFFLYNFFSEIKFFALGIFHLYSLVFFLLNFFVWDFGIFFLFFIKGSAPSSSLVFELLYDYIAILIFYIRLMVQSIRLIIIFLTFMEINDIILDHKMMYKNMSFYSEYNIYNEDGFIDFELENGIFYFLFFKLPDIFFYFLYECIHLIFIIITQFSAFFIMVFWLFLFLYTFFIFEKLEAFFLKRIEFRRNLFNKLYNEIYNENK